MQTAGRNLFAEEQRYHRNQHLSFLFPKEFRAVHSDGHRRTEAMGTFTLFLIHCILAIRLVLEYIDAFSIRIAWLVFIAYCIKTTVPIYRVWSDRSLSHHCIAPLLPCYVGWRSWLDLNATNGVYAEARCNLTTGLHEEPNDSLYDGSINAQ